jgi:RNA polymerase sigma-70 factor (sigma-E family)
MNDEAVTSAISALPLSRDATVIALFRVHYADLVRLARFLVDDVETAEDVVQDAFTGLHRRWRALNDHHAAQAYLRAAVVNGSRSSLRRRGVARRQPMPALVPIRSAETDAVQAEDVREIRAALRALPERQRQVIVLRYYLDLSEADIAGTLGVSAGSVKSHAARGLASLARRLELDR